MLLKYRNRWLKRKQKSHSLLRFSNKCRCLFLSSKWYHFLIWWTHRTSIKGILHLSHFILRQVTQTTCLQTAKLNSVSQSIPTSFNLKYTIPSIVVLYCLAMATALVSINILIVIDETSVYTPSNNSSSVNADSLYSNNY